jgi:tRNA A-37 threonylcarbamoyl transferase component Bud32/DNA-directed RNA polymerase subunit RPC12/RpoP
MSAEDDLHVGTRALEDGLVRPEELLECLLDLVQERRAREGQMAPRPLGMLLVSRGFLRGPDLNRLLAERTAGEPEEEFSFGRVVVACQFATSAQVDECIRIQQDEQKSGGARRLGEILMDRGYLTAPQLQRALAYRNKAIYVCIRCATRFNVLGARPERLYTCKRCGAPLEEARDGESQAESTVHAMPATRRAVGAAAPGGVTAGPADPEADERDRAVAVWVQQKNMVRRPALQEAVQFQAEAAGYGLRVGLVEILKRLKLLSWQQEQALKGVPFAQLVRSDAWKKQAVPGYAIVSKIGSGGFAVLFVAEPVFAGQRVALKMLRPDRAKDPAARDRFLREAALILKLDHPHIVKGFERGEHQGIPYATMELLEGGSLEALAGKAGGLEPARALRIVRQVGDALGYLQREGYIHRDVKPENVLLDGRGEARLCDLGFAAPIRGRRAAEGQAATTVGTAGYMSPEQARGEVDLKVGTDIYSLGLTLYFALTAHRPFEGETSEGVMADRFSGGGVAAPDFDRVKAPAALVEVMKRMLHPDRKERFRSYPELLAALDRC